MQLCTSKLEKNIEIIINLIKEFKGIAPAELERISWLSNKDTRIAIQTAIDRQKN